MSLETAYANGQFAALSRYKLAWPAPTDPTVAGSSVLREKSPTGMSPQATANMAPPTTPQAVSQIFSAHEQGETRTEPRRKLSSDAVAAADMCTSCRKTKHYGSCASPRPIPAKTADFNLGMTGDDPSVSNSNPSTSPHYQSATSASALARAQEGRPANEQAASGFADFFRANGGGINGMADQPGRMYGGLNTATKIALRVFMKHSDNMPGTEIHSMHEQRGTPINPYEEQPIRLSPPVGWGDEGDQRINRAFSQIDHAADTTNIGGGFGDPQPGPAALG